MKSPSRRDNYDRAKPWTRRQRLLWLFARWLLRRVRAVESWGIRLEGNNHPAPTGKQMDALMDWALNRAADPPEHAGRWGD